MLIRKNTEFAMYCVFIAGTSQVTLLTKNAVDFVYLLNTQGHPHFATCFSLLIASLVLQGAVALLVLALLLWARPPASPDISPSRRVRGLNGVATVCFAAAVILDVVRSAFDVHGKTYIAPSDGGKQPAWMAPLCLQNTGNVIVTLG